MYYYFQRCDTEIFLFLSQLAIRNHCKENPFACSFHRSGSYGKYMLTLRDKRHGPNLQSLCKTFMLEKPQNCPSQDFTDRLSRKSNHSGVGAGVHNHSLPERWCLGEASDEVLAEVVLPVTVGAGPAGFPCSFLSQDWCLRVGSIIVVGVHLEAKTWGKNKTLFICISSVPSWCSFW